MHVAKALFSYICCELMCMVYIIHWKLLATKPFIKKFKTQQLFKHKTYLQGLYLHVNSLYHRDAKIKSMTAFLTE